MSNINHYNQSTIIKKYEIYLAYLKLVQTNKENYPEVADYIARGYYYTRLAREFEITAGYAKDIVNEVIKSPSAWEYEYFKRKMDLEMD